MGVFSRNVPLRAPRKGWNRFGAQASVNVGVACRGVIHLMAHGKATCTCTSVCCAHDMQQIACVQNSTHGAWSGDMHMRESVFLFTRLFLGGGCYSSSPPRLMWLWPDVHDAWTFQVKCLAWQGCLVGRVGPLSACSLTIHSR